jgi:hypothetical protein
MESDSGSAYRGSNPTLSIAIGDLLATAISDAGSTPAASTKSK